MLGRLVDGFSMFMTAERLAAIKQLSFPTSLAALDHFIGLANYLRSNIERFAMEIQSLEQRKQETIKQAGKRSSTKN